MKLLSPPGLAGIAILEAAAGERAALLAALTTSSGKPCQLLLGQPPMRAILRLHGQVVDDVLVVARREQTLELHVHGSPAVLDQLDAFFGVSVSEPTNPAERLLREALSVEQFALAVEQQSFDFATALAALRALPPAERRIALAAACERSRVAQAMATPHRVVLVGQQNAGKSSLFNHLLFRERALTGTTPGLTRDAIAEVTTLAGYPYELVDTAGEGEAVSAVDAAAIARGRAWRRDSLVLLVVDGGRGPQRNDRELAAASNLVVSSKADLPQAAWPADLVRALSVSTKDDAAEAIRSRFGRMLATSRGLPLLAPVAPLGGFAALDDLQRQQLISLDADCSAAPPSA